MIESVRETAEQQLCLSPWEQVQLARHKDRPRTRDYIRLMCKNFFELRGDRRSGDDPTIIGGLANFADRTIMIIGHQRDRSAEQGQESYANIPRPEGYRKARRLMLQAEKFGVPVICLIDTPGSCSVLQAEQIGLAQAIAENLMMMSVLRVPIVAVVIGEGGGEGALSLGLADRILMLEHSIYTIASPEVAAAILWRDNTQVAHVAEIMCITAQEVLELGLIDTIISEPVGGAHLDHCISSQMLSEQLQRQLRELAIVPLQDLLEQRFAKFRNIGYCAIDEKSGKCSKYIEKGIKTC